MGDSPATGPRVGRVLVGEERAARMADEAAPSVRGEVLRSAFAISDRHVLTAWHCVRDAISNHAPLWFRLRHDGHEGRGYAYVPLRVTNYDETFDVAVLAVDGQRLVDAHLTVTATAALLGEAAIPISLDVDVNDETQVMGFPESAASADSDTNSARVVDTNLPLGEVSGMKLFGPAFAAVSPVDPHGLSGGPVLKGSQTPGGFLYAAVGVIRAVPIGSIPGVAAGGGLIATRIKDVAERLPEVTIALLGRSRAWTTSQALAVSRVNNVLTVSHACWSVLRHSVVEVDDPVLGRLVGWPHFLDEPVAHRRPTAIGTAYGLKLALVLGEQDYGLDRSALAATLWKLRRPDGGWAARTGTGVGRPEVSALVLGALSACACNATQLAEAAAAFEETLSLELDPAGMERTYVVSAVMRGLVRVCPKSPRLAQLRAVLLAGAIQDPDHGNMLCWSGRLKADRHHELAPSAAHTAQAVVALVRAGHLLGEDTQSRTTLEQAVRWLASHRDLANQTEQIRRFVRENQPWETLTIRHFTACWVARALLVASPGDLSGADTLLDEAMHEVWQAYRDGFWEWPDHERPLWMTYQGASAARDYAMRTSAPA